MRVKPVLAALILLMGLLSGSFNSNVSAAEAAKNRGLLITPLRTYEEVSAGETKKQSFTLVNLTEKPLAVELSLERFKIADAAYNYTFDRVENNWVTIAQSKVTIQPNKSHAVAYTIAVPRDAAPGGHYYTLLASATLNDQGFAGTVRAATLLYLTVKGQLVRTSTIEKATAPPIAFSPQIHYSLDVKNTGNIHYFAYFSAQLDSLFYRAAPTGASNLLMPGTTRHIEGSINSPILPGVYKLSYGFRSDSGENQYRTQYVLFLPPWSIVLVLLVGLAVYRLRRGRPHTTTDSSQPPYTPPN